MEYNNDELEDELEDEYDTDEDENQGEGMRSFFFANITAAQKVRLRTARIAFFDFIINTVEGIVIEGDEDNAHAAAEHLDFRIVSTSLSPYEGVVIAVVVPINPDATAAERTSQRQRRNPVPGCRVTTAAWNDRYGRKERMVEVVREVLVPGIQRSVKISVAHGMPRGYVDAPVPGTVGLHLGEGVQRGSYAPKTVLGVQLAYDHLGMHPEGMGTILTDEEGFEYAQIDGDHIWILIAIGGRCDETEVALLRRILEEVVAEQILSPETKADRDRMRMEQRRPQSRKMYMELCANRLMKAVEHTERDIAKGTAEVEKLQSTLITKIREIRGLERKLPSLKAAQSADVEKFGVEFDKLLTVPKVVNVEVTANAKKLRIFTDTLYCIDPRTRIRHDIGKFRIDISVDGGSEVLWTNMTRKVRGMESGMNAPHVFSNGRACLGNTHEIFPDLIANYEFAAVAMVAIQFVESVNVDDGAGVHINDWPVAAEQNQNAA